MLVLRMTFILKTKEYVGKTLGIIDLFIVKLRVNNYLKNFVKNQDNDTLSFDIIYNNDHVKILHKKMINKKEVLIDARFFFDGESGVYEKISMYPVILSEAVKMFDFKEKTIMEVRGRCLVDTEDRNVVEFLWGNVIIMRSKFVVKRFDSKFFVAVSSDGLDFNKYYDVYDYLDMPPIFFVREKYKETFIRNLKNLVEEELN